MEITVYRFEFKKTVDGKNPFDVICRECGLKPDVIDSLTFNTSLVKFNNGQAVEEPTKPNIITVDEKEETIDEHKKEHPTPEVVEEDIRGHKVCDLGNNGIWSNPLKDFKKAVEDGTPLKDVFRKYTSAIDSSLNVYVCAYKRYLRGDREPKQRSYNYKKKKLDDAYKFSKIYHTWTTQAEINSVINAICHIEYDYVPTAKAIIKLTSMAKVKVWACLDVLIQENKINYVKVKRERVYSLIKKDKPQFEDDDIALVKSAIKNKGKPTLKEIRDTISMDKNKMKSILAYLKQKGEIDIYYTNSGDTTYKVIQ